MKNLSSPVFLVKLDIPTTRIGVDVAGSMLILRALGVIVGVVVGEEWEWDGRGGQKVWFAEAGVEGWDG